MLQAEHLSRHVTIHTNELPFKCDICERQFRVPYTLTVHRRSAHTNERPYECELCDKKFMRSDHLNNHVRAIHINPLPPKPVDPNRKPRRPEKNPGRSHKKLPEWMKKVRAPKDPVRKHRKKVAQRSEDGDTSTRNDQPVKQAGEINTVVETSTKSKVSKLRNVTCGYADHVIHF
jgi:hypothetical protein